MEVFPHRDSPTPRFSDAVPQATILLRSATVYPKTAQTPEGKGLVLRDRPPLQVPTAGSR